MSQAKSRLILRVCVRTHNHLSRKETLMLLCVCVCALSQLQMFALKYKQAFHACACALHTNCASEPHKGKIINGARGARNLFFRRARTQTSPGKYRLPLYTHKDACVHIRWVESGRCFDLHDD